MGWVVNLVRDVWKASDFVCSPLINLSNEEKEEEKEKHTFLWLTRHFGGKVAPHMRLSPPPPPDQLGRVGWVV